MNCRNAQRMFGDLADGKLSEPVVAELHRHIAECTDCRVAQQRAARLLQLVSLKRYENPGTAYFDGFLKEFHQRLEAETTTRPGWRDVVADSLRTVPARFFQYGLAGAVGVCVLGVVLWYSSQTSSSPAQQSTAAVAKPVELASPAMLTNATTLPVETVTLADESDNFSPNGVIVLPSAVRAQRSAPRYVLDHITATPASYETASCDF